MIRAIQERYKRAIIKIAKLTATCSILLTLLQASSPNSPKETTAHNIRYERKNTQQPTALPTHTPSPELTPITTPPATAAPQKTPTPALIPTQEAKPTPETEQKALFRFGKIELGPDTGAPGKPTCICIESTQENFVLFFRTKKTPRRRTQ